MKTPDAVAAALACAALSVPSVSHPFQLEFQRGVGAWSTVLDGVMGGRSTGRVRQPEPGILRFEGELSLANNGGFAQMRTAVDEGALDGAAGLVVECRGDGRTYTFDLRASDVRMMAGSFQQRFETRAGEWTEVRLPIADFRLHSFGRTVRNAPTLDPARIESLGVTLADKRAGSFALELRSIRAYGPDGLAAAPAGADRDLVSVARAAGLDTLLACLGAADLELPEGPVTIFAPTDAAFDALPAGTVARLSRPENRATLRAILLHHVVDGARGSDDVLNRRALPALSGQELAIDLATGTVAGAGLVTTDVPFDGGVVHVIDRVLLPETRSIAELAVADERLTTLVAAVKAADLVGQLDGDNGPWTVFAPIDGAFAKLPESALAALLEPQNRDELTRVLGLHVVPGRIAARELLQKRSLTTLLGDPIDITLVDRELRVGGAALVAADIQARNGVVHLLDSVITAPTADVDAGSDRAPPRDRSADVARLVELAVERGAPLFNQGQPEACAAVYELAVAAIVGLGAEDVPAELLGVLRMELEQAAALDDARSRAWALRRALDRAYRGVADTAPRALRPRR